MAAAAKDFARNLQAQLEGLQEKTNNEKKMLRILKGPDSPKRTKKLWQWENAARAAGGIDPKTGAIDWSKIDWGALLVAIIKAILPFLLA